MEYAEKKKRRKTGRRSEGENRRLCEREYDRVRQMESMTMGERDRERDRDKEKGTETTREEQRQREREGG